MFQNQVTMEVTSEKNEKVANMIFASIYPHYVNRLENNNRTKRRTPPSNRMVNWF